MTEIHPSQPLPVRPRLRAVSNTPRPPEPPIAPVVRSVDAIAIERANLRRGWLEASAEVTRQLLADHTQSALDLVLRHAATGSGADAASLIFKNMDGQWVVRALSGDLSDVRLGETIDPESSLTGRVIRSRCPERVEDYAAEIAGDRPTVFAAAIGAPILGESGQVLGVLIVARATGHPPFATVEAEQLADFTRQVGAALDLDRARSDREAARLGEERDRIAADLHDHVIQELFATSMGLQQVASGLPQPQLQSQVLGYVGALDETIRRIRQTIFSVQSHRWSVENLQGRLLSVLDQQAEALGFNPEIEFAGPLRLGISHAMAEDIVAVVREGLSNVARHARARHARIAVTLVDEVVTVTITDDGVGMNGPARDSGLANLRHRAECRGGRFAVSSPLGGGTRLEWIAQVEADP
jgi:signal transduction histidine kinase